MKSISVFIVDYHLGNHSSVANCLSKLGFRVRVSDSPEELSTADVLILPGVGAFPAAMAAIRDLGLDSYLLDQAAKNKPIVGICLGMQLLADSSLEYQYTEGLGLIPGQIVALEKPRWHIGWNSIECIKSDPLFAPSNGKNFYFNHSFIYRESEEHSVCISEHSQPFSSVIRRGNTVGLQFHPEKSQDSGRELLHNLVLGLLHA